MIIEELKASLQAAGLVEGSIVYISSDVASFGIPKELRKEVLARGFEVLLNGYIDTFKSIVADSGILIMPTFTYSFCKSEIYNVQETPSTVGVLTEYFRKRNDVCRNRHPIFSVAAFGKQAKSYTSLSSFDCFGEESIFGKLYKDNAFYITFGIHMQQGLTAFYYSEQKKGVPYRCFKDFDGIIVDRNEKINVKSRYYVRKYDIEYEDYWYDIEKKALLTHMASEFIYNGAPVIITRAAVLDKLIQRELEKDIYCLISTQVGQK